MAALDMQKVLRDEAEAIHGASVAPGPKLYRALLELKSAALCLSGGGIRSAAFALGVVQALAAHPASIERKRGGKTPASLLAQFHYLSTVSGGGYIGSWLSAWIMRAGFAPVRERLVKRSNPDEEAPPIGWLRGYSNFLTPKLGLASADAWAAVALYLRNLTLNWIVILPLLCVALLTLKLMAIAVAWFSQFDPKSCEPWFYGFAMAGCLSLIVALGFVTRNRPTRGSAKATQEGFLGGGLLPAGLAALCFTFAIATPCAHDKAIALNWFPSGAMSLVAFGLGVGAALYALAWISAFPRFRTLTDYVWDFIAWTFAGAVYGALMSLGVHLYFGVWGLGIWPFEPSEVLLVVFAVPWALTAQLLAEMIFVGLTSYEKDSDSDREWLGRAAGWLMVTALVWLVVMFLVFVGSSLMDLVYDDFRTWLGGGISGTITALVGKSARSPAQGAAKDKKQLSLNIILAVAAPIFVAILVVMISAGLDRILLGQSLITTASFRAVVTQNVFPAWPGGLWLPVALLAAAAIGLAASFLINVNRFSLHGMYRNRLIRAFLGASRPDRDTTRNPFTDFDSADNPRIAELWQQQKRAGRPDDDQAGMRRLFHVLNTALNIVSSKKLAWQERKAESFTVTPLHTGGTCVGFRPSNIYGDPYGGISLGTAMAISGAAASPNMGYHSSPPLALLLTLFNVRLGWWLGSPRSENKKVYGGEGPRWAAASLLSEMFGLTTDEGKYVYLSDGGHFENLGLYEMVRRRCHFIVVSDAGCDPTFGFEDLGNAVRKIEIDLGIKITFARLSELRTLRRDGGKAEDEFSYYGLRSIAAEDIPYYAVGTIHYPEAARDDEKGTILYIKAAYHGNETNMGVCNYGIAHPAFPHEGTGDQWFSESQFESYRALGSEAMNNALENVRSIDDKLTDAPPLTSLDVVVKNLRDIVRER